MASNGKEFKLKFQFEKSTKGAHRFQEIDDKGNVKTTSGGATIGTMYLRKDQVGNDAPKGLEVVIKPLT